MCQLRTYYTSTALCFGVFHSFFFFYFKLEIRELSAVSHPDRSKLVFFNLRDIPISRSSSTLLIVQYLPCRRTLTGVSPPGCYQGTRDDDTYLSAPRRPNGFGFENCVLGADWLVKTKPVLVRIIYSSPHSVGSEPCCVLCVVCRCYSVVGINERYYYCRCSLVPITLPYVPRVQTSTFCVTCSPARNGGILLLIVHYCGFSRYMFLFFCQNRVWRAHT